MLIQSKFNSERDLIAKLACQTGVVPKFIRLSSNVEKNDKKDKTLDYLINVEHMNMYVSPTCNTCSTCFLFSLGQEHLHCRKIKVTLANFSDVIRKHIIEFYTVVKYNGVTCMFNCL